MKVNISIRNRKVSVSRTLVYPYDLDKEFTRIGIPKPVVEAIDKAVDAASHVRDAQALMYAKSIRPALEQNGLHGVRQQIRHLLDSLSKWIGQDAKHYKHVLNHWLRG